MTATEYDESQHHQKLDKLFFHALPVLVVIYGPEQILILLRFMLDVSDVRQHYVSLGLVFQMINDKYC